MKGSIRQGAAQRYAHLLGEPRMELMNEQLEAAIDGQALPETWSGLIVDLANEALSLDGGRYYAYYASDGTTWVAVHERDRMDDWYQCPPEVGRRLSDLNALVATWSGGHASMQGATPVHVAPGWYWSPRTRRLSLSREQLLSAMDGLRPDPTWQGVHDDLERSDSGTGFRYFVCIREDRKYPWLAAVRWSYNEAYRCPPLVGRRLRALYDMVTGWVG